MSYTARFELPNYDEFDEVDLSNCDHCPHADGNCWNAGRCLVEDY